MEISVTDALALFTNEIIAKFSDHKKPMSFGRSMFTEVETASKLASFIIERGMSLIATDIARGSRGNLNVFDKSTQNILVPPFFNEYINLVEMSSYDALYVEGVNSKIAWGRFLDDVAGRMEFCMDKIDRRYELQCWQALETGIVTLNNGNNVVYPRQSGSLVDPGEGNYWDDAIDPYKTTFDRGSKWLNEDGKMIGNTINIIFGGNAWKAYLSNAAVVARDLKFNNQLEVLANRALIDSVGKIFKGATTIGAFNYQFWLYNDFYEIDNGDGTTTKRYYMHQNKVIMQPDVTKNTLTYCAVPQKLRPGMTPKKGKFLMWTAEDNMKDAEFAGVKSAGIPCLVAVDQVYTERVMAD
jgi:hypothetical protein